GARSRLREPCRDPCRQPCPSYGRTARSARWHGCVPGTAAARLRHGWHGRSFCTLSTVRVSLSTDGPKHSALLYELLENGLEGLPADRLAGRAEGVAEVSLAAVGVGGERGEDGVSD